MEDSSDDEILLPKKRVRVIMRIFHDCLICCEEREKISTFRCKHQICDGCVGNLRSLKCPYCRGKLTMDDIGMKDFLTIKSRQKEDKLKYNAESTADFIRGIIPDENDEEDEQHFIEFEGDNYTDGVEYLNALYESTIDMPETPGLLILRRIRHLFY